MPSGETEKIKVFLEKNIGCFYRYFGEDIESSRVNLVTSENSYVGGKINAIDKEAIKTGCAIIQNENNKNFRMEVVLMKENKARIYYIFLENSKLNFYFYWLKKDTSSNKWSINNTSWETTEKWIVHPLSNLTFKYNLKYPNSQTSEGNVHDLMLSLPANLPETSGSIAKHIMNLNWTSDKTNLELNLYGEWIKRDKYCEERKDKRISSLSEKPKIEEWCSSRL